MTDNTHLVKRPMRILCSILLLAGNLSASAQQVRLGPLHSADSPRENWLLPGDTVVQAGKKMIYSGKPVKNQSLGTPREEKKDGLHVSVGLSAFATFGKNVPHHGGFTQTIDADYLTPLTKDGKLWLKVGGYLNNMNWGGDNYRDLGLYAVMGYKFNEHWEAYIYGQLSVANNYNSSTAATWATGCMGCALTGCTPVHGANTEAPCPEAMGWGCPEPTYWVPACNTT